MTVSLRTHDMTNRSFAHRYYIVMYILFLGPGMDFIIQTSSVKLTNQSRSQLVSIKLLVDGVAQEPVETFTLDLLPVEPSTIPEGTGVFFQQMLIVNIQDADSKLYTHHKYYNIVMD